MTGKGEATLINPADPTHWGKSNPSWKLECSKPMKAEIGTSLTVKWLELDHKKGRALKNWCFLIVVLEKTFETPLDSKEIKWVNPQGNQPWIFIGRIDAAAEAPKLWPPDVKNRLLGKDPDAGKDWRQEEKGGKRSWDGWMASPTQWTWVWANSGRQWRRGKPGVL